MLPMEHPRATRHNDVITWKRNPCHILEPNLIFIVPADVVATIDNGKITTNSSKEEFSMRWWYHYDIKCTWRICILEWPMGWHGLWYRWPFWICNLTTKGDFISPLASTTSMETMVQMYINKEIFLMYFPFYVYMFAAYIYPMETVYLETYLYRCYDW